MSRDGPRRGVLSPPQENVENLTKLVKDGNCYGAQQMYKSVSARYISAERYSDALDILQSGACIQLEYEQITCGAELGVLFVETLVKGKFLYDEDTLDHDRKIYKKFPRIPVPQHLDLADDDDLQKLHEAFGAAKTRVDGCSSFLKAAIKYLPLGNLRDANYLMDELKKQVKGKEVDFPKSDLIKFINYLLQTLVRDVLPLFNMLRQTCKSSIDREPVFNEFLDVIGEKFYGVQCQNLLQGIFGDMFKLPKDGR